ncbi:MAG: prepilin-type N-terminal cleavage/methylation domain-containing protein [Actinomycetia bacterium]|nr:prepilin-type N-terminal cleavage/methylation domain-containing protein [Actinomycetes bacterium]
MKWFYNRMYKKEKGFTLVELMVVIIILAVLTGIAVPSYLALRNRAREQATRSEMLNIGTAIAIYEADTGHFPIAATMVLMIPMLETPGYMTDVPSLDAWGTAYTYVSADPGATYTLTSPGGGTVITMLDGAFTGE